MSGQTVKYNLKKRLGRGFTFEELKVVLPSHLIFRSMLRWQSKEKGYLTCGCSQAAHAVLTYVQRGPSGAESLQEGKLKPVRRQESVMRLDKIIEAASQPATDVVQEAGISVKLAPTIGIAVDHRRRNRSLESLQVRHCAQKHQQSVVLAEQSIVPVHSLDARS